MTTQVGNPFPVFYDLRGRPLDQGKIFIGAVGEDPELAPIDVFADLSQTDVVIQPIATLGGRMAREGNLIFAFIAEQQYSIRVKDADGATVFYAAVANPSASNFQAGSDVLTAIADATVTDYGIGLLSASSAEELRAKGNIPDALPLAGGTMTGAIRRQTAGAYAYANDPAFSDIRLFFTENGAADPRTQNGDIWFEEEPA